MGSFNKETLEDDYKRWQLNLVPIQWSVTQQIDHQKKQRISIWASDPLPIAWDLEDFSGWFGPANRGCLTSYTEQAAGMQPLLPSVPASQPCNNEIQSLLPHYLPMSSHFSTSKRNAGMFISWCQICFSVCSSAFLSISQKLCQYVRVSRVQSWVMSYAVQCKLI